MMARSPTAASRARAFVSDSPRPMLRTIFLTVGIAITLEYFISSRNAGATSSINFCLSRGSMRFVSVMIMPCRNYFVAMLAHPHMTAVGQDGASLTSRPMAIRTHQHHIGTIEWGRHIDDARLQTA